MRTLITGVAGFAGGHLVEHLTAATDWDIWGNVLRTDHLRLVGPGVRGIVADLRDPGAARELVEQARPNFVFHLAAQAFVPQSWADPWGTLETNLRSQINLFEALLRSSSQARVLVIGSNEEYGQVRSDELPVKEHNPLRPDSPYAVSKIAQDFLGLQYFLSRGLPVVRVRPFNHIGPRQGEKFVASAFAKQIASIEVGLQPPVVKVGNLNTQRDFTDARDMVRAYYLALTQGEIGDVYNIGSGTPRRIQDVLDTLLSYSRSNVRIEIDSERMRPSDTPIMYCDASKFMARTGWTPTISFEQTLRDVLDDWRTRIRET